MDDDIYKNIEEYNQNRKRKNSIVFDSIIANMLSNNKFNLKLMASLIRGKKLNISPVFITQFYFVVPQNIRLSYTHNFIMKLSNKQTTASTNSI